jgi:uracil-DNA glycosylase
MLHQEWGSCVKCDLGSRRISNEGRSIVGEGVRNGVMFIGEGTNGTDEEWGRPFMDEPGQILRQTIAHLGLRDFYLTTIVACRSCSPWVGGNGQPIFRKNWKTKQMEVSYRDENPNPLQVAACLPRLQEEIYLVDPVVIVAVGALAAKTLIGKSVSIHSPEVRGVPIHISIPGAGSQAVRTDKRDAWVRKGKGGMQMPVEQSSVRYICIPTIDLPWVHKKFADQGDDSPFKHFARDIQKAVQVYERYMLELHGTIPSGQADHPVEISADDIHPPE